MALFDTHNGRHLQSISGPYIVSAAFSPDSRYFITAKDDPRMVGNNWHIFRWDGGHFVLEDKLKPRLSANRFTFSRDSKTLAVSGEGGDLAVVDFPSLKPRAVWHYGRSDGAPDFVGGLALSPDGKYLSSYHPGVFELWEWNIASHTKRRQISVNSTANGATPGDPKYLLDYSPDGTMWVLDGWQVGDASTFKTERRLPHKVTNTAQLFTPDGDLLVGDAGGTITRWS